MLHLEAGVYGFSAFRNFGHRRFSRADTANTLLGVTDDQKMGMASGSGYIIF
jgi:hypothetical protein